MDRRLLQLQALQQYFDDNAEVARTFQHEYKALTWRAVEETKRHDPEGLAEYVELGLHAISQLDEEVGAR